MTLREETIQKIENYISTLKDKNITDRHEAEQMRGMLEILAPEMKFNLHSKGRMVSIAVL